MVVGWVVSEWFFVNCGRNSISGTMFPENEVICGPSSCCASVEIISREVDVVRDGNV